MWKRTEKGAIKSKGTIGTGKAETDDFDLDGEMDAVTEEIESTLVEHMPPDTMLAVRSIMLKLEIPGLLIIAGKNFLLKRKIMLEKIFIIHYSVYVRSKNAVRACAEP